MLTFSLLLCVVGLIYRVPLSSFMLIAVAVAEKEHGMDMDGNEGLEEEAIEMTVRDEADKTDERIFRVGELVEYWEGSFVRGYRTDSGHPAYVKRVEGGGKYAIKMVGLGRGKYRQIEWRQLFKDGSFNKTVARGHGARVREEARLKERAKEEAEAKLGEELRETKRALEKGLIFVLVFGLGFSVSHPSPTLTPKG